MNKSRNKFNKPSLEEEAEKEEEEREEKEAFRLGLMFSRAMFFGIIIAFILLGFGFSNYKPEYCNSYEFCGFTAAQFLLAISLVLGFLTAYIFHKLKIS